MKFVYIFLICLAVFGIGCSEKPSKPVVSVSGDTTFVSSPAMVLSKKAWKATLVQGTNDPNFDLDSQAEALLYFFPSDTAMFFDINTRYLVVKESNHLIDMTAPPHFFMIGLEGKVSPIVDVKSSIEKIEKYMGIKSPNI
jgi:hypothetical protein